MENLFWFSLGFCTPFICCALIFLYFVLTEKIPDADEHKASFMQGYGNYKEKP